MSHHLKFIDEIVSKQSPQGELNIELLRLNSDESISYRKNLLKIIFLLVTVVLNSKRKKNKKEEIINSAVEMLSTLTHHSEQKIRLVLQV